MKYLDKIEYQNKVNPGHKSRYTPKLRPRSTVFELKTSYNRQKNKKELNKEMLEV